MTHDQSEALALSHEIAVMNEGRIVQIGSPRDIYERPRNKFVADFVGTTNFVRGHGGGGRGLARQLSRRFRDRQAAALPPPSRYRGGDAGAGLGASRRRGNASLVRPDGDNVLEGKVDVKVFLGEYMDYQIRIGALQVLARVHPSINLAVGDTVYVRMNPEKCISIQDSARYKQAA